MLTWKQRRMMMSTWRRWTRWEFWPLYVFYPPVLMYVFYLGIKHRGLTLFTAVNPAMPESGFIEESKSAILQGLGDNGGDVALWHVIPVAGSLDTKLEQLAYFMWVNQLDFPIVLKPDVGQRGAGVAIVDSQEAASDFFKHCRRDVIAQKYVVGVEYGVFYYRYPNKSQGAILGITTKEFTHVTGDGVHTLETLILQDARAVCMARFFFKQHADQLNTVLAKGERYTLAALGTHCRGALFRDGADLVTDELTAAVDSMSQRYPGFYFGRYDLKVPSVEHLKQGRGIQVIELNGVTSEATYIYDPQHSVWFAWKTLFRQWRIAFEIAAVNRRRGAQPASLRRLLHLLTR